jgi:hypothetical protein
LIWIGPVKGKTTIKIEEFSHRIRKTQMVYKKQNLGMGLVKAVFFNLRLRSRGLKQDESRNRHGKKGTNHENLLKKSGLGLE